MRIYNILLIALLSFIFFSACKSTGQKALQKGDYYAACLQAIEKLRSSPDNKKAIDALKQAYPLAENYTEKEVTRILSSQSDNSKYLKVYNLYGKMNKLAVQISRSPAALRIIPNPDYYNKQLEGARNMAAEETYQKAELNLRTGKREDAKEAYYLYQSVNKIISGYKDVAQKMDEAKWLATIKVVVEQVPVQGAYKISADFFQTKVFEYLSGNIRNQFIRVYSPQEAERAKLKPDQIVRLQFLDFVVGQVRESKNTTDVTRDSVIVGTYKDNRGKVHDVYGTVKAKLTIRQREVSSSGLLDASIIDYDTKKTVSQQRFPGTYVWKDRWGSFNGDERALSKKQLEICRREPMLPPPPQDMFIEFTVPIFNELTNFMQNYYRRF